MEKVKEIVRVVISPLEINSGKSSKYALLQVLIHRRAISAFRRTFADLRELSLVLCP